jgi:thiol-disulfide isomerase/thioredoxin
LIASSAPLARLALAVACSTLAATASPAADGAAPAGAVQEGLKAGTAAPTFLLPVVNEVADAQGKAVTKFGPGKWTALPAGNTDQKKLVVLSFFATYCDPCKKEMPELARLYDAYKDQGLGVMLVSIDKGDEQKQQIIELAKTSAVKFPVTHDRFQVVARRYAAERLPYMLMLDGTGNIKTVHVGYTEELKANLENEVRAGLGLEPLAPAPDKNAKGTKKGAKNAKAGGKGKG